MPGDAITDDREPLVFGLGREGRSTLRHLLRDPACRPIAVDDDAAAVAQLDALGDAAARVRFLVGAQATDALARARTIVRTASLSPDRSELAAARARGARVTTNVGLFADRLGERAFVAVTGTKGKSTTAALLAHLLAAEGRAVALGGNIGVPALDLLDGPAADVVVLELSSYQLADAELAPDVAVLTNLSPEHQDWHGGVEAYYAAKLRLAKGARRVVASGACATLAGRLADAGATPIEWFDVADGVHARGGVLHDGDRALLALEGTRLRGAHHASNACAALTALRALDRALGQPARAVATRTAALDALGTFAPLPHRTEELGIRDGLLWVDDGLATVPAAVEAALAVYRGRPRTVLVGGLDRGHDWTSFGAVLARERGLAVIAMPSSGAAVVAAIERACAAARGEREARGVRARGTGEGAIAATSAPSPGSDEAGPRVESARDLEHAVRLAREVTPQGGVVLLSPGAPSFDRFADHRERSAVFARAAGFATRGRADDAGAERSPVAE